MAQYVMMGGGPHGVKGIEVRSFFEIYGNFGHYFNSVDYRIRMVPVQILWGLKVFHNQQVKRNVTYQLQTWQSIQSVKQYGNVMFWGHEILGQ